MKYQIEGVRTDSLFVRLAMMLGTAIIAAYIIIPRWFDEGGPRKLVKLVFSRRILKYIFSIRGAVTILTYLAFAAFVLYVGCYHSPY